MIDYRLVNDYVSKKSGLSRVIRYSGKAITTLTVILYISLLVYIGFHDGFTPLCKNILITGGCFAGLSVFRKKLNMPRPYEVYGFAPIIEKNTKGKSFPSRHVFSIFLIAVAYFYYGGVFSYIAIFIAFIGILLCVIRVAGCVHFLKDVIAGAVSAVIMGVICYSFIDIL